MSNENLIREAELESLNGSEKAVLRAMMTYGGVCIIHLSNLVGRLNVSSDNPALGKIIDRLHDNSIVYRIPESDQVLLFQATIDFLDANPEILALTFT